MPQDVVWDSKQILFQPGLQLCSENQKNFMTFLQFGRNCSGTTLQIAYGFLDNLANFAQSRSG
jgi:hypothetical protein